MRADADTNGVPLGLSAMHSVCYKDPFTTSGCSQLHWGPRRGRRATRLGLRGSSGEFLLSHFTDWEVEAWGGHTKGWPQLALLGDSLGCGGSQSSLYPRARWEGTQQGL